MRAFETTFDIVLYRFFLMMGIILVSFISGAPFLAILAVPVFLSALLGIKFFDRKEEESAATVRKMSSTRMAA